MDPTGIGRLLVRDALVRTRHISRSRPLNQETRQGRSTTRHHGDKVRGITCGEYRNTSLPTGASWLNLIERFFAEITRKRIRRGTFRGVPALIAAIRVYVRKHNKHPRPFIWTATAFAGPHPHRDLARGLG